MVHVMALMQESTAVGDSCSISFSGIRKEISLRLRPHEISIPILLKEMLLQSITTTCSQLLWVWYCHTCDQTCTFIGVGSNKHSLRWRQPLAQWSQGSPWLNEVMVHVSVPLKLVHGLKFITKIVYTPEDHPLIPQVNKEASIIVNTSRNGRRWPLTSQDLLHELDLTKSIKIRAVCERISLEAPSTSSRIDAALGISIKTNFLSLIFQWPSRPHFNFSDPVLGMQAPISHPKSNNGWQAHGSTKICENERLLIWRPPLRRLISNSSREVSLYLSNNIMEELEILLNAV